jgi:hypothetical protein
MRQNDGSRFVCSYAGEVEVEVDGTHYTIRYFLSDYHHRTTSFAYRYQCAAQVGTIRRTHEPTEYPPPAVIARFPGIVGLRYHVTRYGDVEYSGGILKNASWAEYTIETTDEPSVEPYETIGLQATVHAEEMRQWTAFRQE